MLPPLAQQLPVDYTLSHVLGSFSIDSKGYNCLSASYDCCNEIW